MNIYKSGEEISLSIDPRQKINKFAFDGYSYYFTSQCSCEIVKLDSCLCFVGCYDTCRPYDCICYDGFEDCFWATSQGECGSIFKLDRSMVEIDRITINECPYLSGVLTGISYNCCRNTLTVSSSNCVAEVDKCSGDACIKYEPDCCWITGVMSLCPGYLVTCVEKCRQYIYVIDEYGCVMNKHGIDCDTVVNGVALNPFVCNFPQIYFEFLVLRKGCYPYIYRRTVLADDLGFIPCPCNFEKHMNPCCKCKCCRECCEECCKECCERCCREHCERCCRECCERCCREYCEHCCKECCERCCRECCKECCEHCCKEHCERCCKEHCERCCRECCERCCRECCERCCKEHCEKCCRECCEKCCKECCERCCREHCEKCCKECCERCCREHCEHCCRERCEECCREEDSSTACG